MTQHITTMQVPLAGAVTGRLIGFADTGAPLVNVEHEPSQVGVEARSCVPLSHADIGRQLVIVGDTNDANRPIVLGVIRPLDESRTLHVIADGEEVVVQAAESLTLKCGAASIRLERSGKIVIRGKHIVSHAAGVNRVRGGSVELN
jgi:hypothetical protein